LYNILFSEATVNLKKSVDRTFIAQALDAPDKSKIRLITNKVTTPILNSPCTSIAYTLNALSTDFFRVNVLFGIVVAFEQLQFDLAIM